MFGKDHTRMDWRRKQKGSKDPDQAVRRDGLCHKELLQHDSWVGALTQWAVRLGGLGAPRVGAGP